MKRFAARSALVSSCAALLMLLAAGALAGEFQRSFTLDSRELKVANLVGAVDVAPSPDQDFHVTVRVQGQDAREELLDFQVKEGSKGFLKVGFPVDQHRKYVYPALGRGSKTTFSVRDENGVEERSWLKKLFSGFKGTRITVQGKGNGLEMWADMVIQVPEGRILEVEHGVGNIVADGLKADVVLDSNSGTIEARNIAGDVVADTGSGAVAVADVRGDILVDTGSGRVKVERTKGRKLMVDTGSGGVEVADVSCDELHVDTGSGGVKARKVLADSAVIDTGSGSVELQLERLGNGRYLVDTGSGGIDLDLPEGASARILAETGSGRVTYEEKGATVNAKDRGELDLTLGEGEVRVVLDAGSGSINIR